MSENTPLEILKNAILLETRGRAFYQTASDQTPHPAVKDFFKMMADEEQEHIRLLSAHYASVRNARRFTPTDYGDVSAPDAASKVLTDELRTRISAAGFESAAISAAVAMEEKAVAFYADRGKKSDDPEEKRLYNWLAEWERGHLNMLLSMDRALTEKIWNDNQFWPF